jgi:hypothetical protein
VGSGDRTRNHVVNLRNISKFTRNQWYKYMYKPSKMDLNSRCLIGITPLMGISREDLTRNFTPVPCRPAPEAANKPQCEPDQHGKGPTGLAVVFPPVNEQRCGKPRIVPETPWFLHAFPHPFEFPSMAMQQEPKLEVPIYHFFKA